MINSFNSKAVSKIIGIPFRVIDYWDRTAFIKPSVSEASGYGSVRLYSFTDLIQFRVAKFFRDRGLSLQKIRKSLHFLRKHLPEVEQPLAELRFLTDGETIFVLTNKDKVIMDTLKQGQYVLTIAIGKLINDLKGMTTKITMDRTYMVNVAKRRFKVVLHPDLEDGGYWIECPELPGCSSQGESVEEALDMIKDAVKGHLEVEKELEKEKGAKRRAA
jgi:predicted RNase H-like HicB family nuclease/DNA-binding transcriptional MerR regulator